MEAESKHLEFIKNNENDVIFWVDNVETIGEFLFTFDKVKIYNLFADYPQNMSEREKEIFDKENPYWRDFFQNKKETSLNINLTTDDKIALECAVKDEYSEIEYLGRWGQYKVYNAVWEGYSKQNPNEMPYPIGLPQFILVADGKARFSDTDETMSLMRLFCE
jgi:hypothetical protein